MSGTNKLAVVVHGFHPDIFAGLYERLERLDTPFKLYVSIPKENGGEVRDILGASRHPCEIHEVENRGRDIAPFLKIMPRVREERFPYVLKLHTKKSSYRRTGDRWRNELYDFLTGNNQLHRSLDLMERDSAIGIITHPGYVIPMRTNWRANESRVRELAARMGLKNIEPDDDAFAAGSMFLARVPAIEPLLRLSTTQDEFEPEEGQKDRTLAHAIERAFTYSAKAAGLRLAGSEDTARVLANYRKFGKLWKLRLGRVFRRISGAREETSS